MRQKKKKKQKPKGTIKPRSSLKNTEKYCTFLLGSFLVNGMGIEIKIVLVAPWPSPDYTETQALM